MILVLIASLTPCGHAIAQTAYVQFINASEYPVEGMPVVVDVYLNDVLVADDLPFRAATAFGPYASGAVKVDVAPADAADNSSPLLTSNWTLSSSGSYFAVLRGDIQNGAGNRSLAWTLVANARQWAAADRFYSRDFNAVADLPDVSVSFNSDTYLSNLPYGAAGPEAVVDGGAAHVIATDEDLGAICAVEGNATKLLGKSQLALWSGFAQPVNEAYPRVEVIAIQPDGTTRISPRAGGGPDPKPGPVFGAFLASILSAAPGARQALVDDFTSSISEWPLIEQDTLAHFVFLGTFSSGPFLVGDPYYWHTGAMKLWAIEGTTAWYKVLSASPSARIEYKFTYQGNWYTDPLNPNTFGPYDNSVLSMPEYRASELTEPDPGIDHGTIVQRVVSSTALNQSRRVDVYLPPGYESGSEDYPVVVFHDGLDWFMGPTRDVLDNMIDRQMMTPIIGAFVPPVHRDEEYHAAGSRYVAYRTFLIDELLPELRSEYRIRSGPENTGTVGISSGGGVTLSLCDDRPDAFGNCGAFSASTAASTLIRLSTEPKQDLDIYLDWGAYEVGFASLGRMLRDDLLAQGYVENVDLKWKEWAQGHGWVSWINHLNEALEFLFPAQPGVGAAGESPVDFALEQNYPNPFNPTTTISYSVPKLTKTTLSVFDLLGRQIRILASATRPVGTYEVTFDATGLPSGVYLYRLTAGDYVETKRMIIVK
jgi:enterochelin esterase-like enzyme